jgi:Fe2+ or Zn2+ uptake regulation protein
MNTHRYQTQIVKIIGEEHRTADDIFVKMRKKFDRIGIATVYRNLDKLVDD